ncbi:MAG: O-antigen ligase domain-containing protein [Planctomycetota bacterium]
MYWLAEAMLWGWLPVVLLLFLVMPARRAVVVALIVSWLLLPELAIELKFVPDYTKMAATCYGIILGALLLDPQSRVLKFKPRWIDIPIVVWCVCPLFTSISNGLGPYDGATSVVGRVLLDGLPYLIGRLYFRSPEEVKDFAYGVVVGGLFYVPLCLYEVRMSPHLHQMLYGFQPFQDWSQAKRWGGFRPTVFLRHGLAVGVWMTATAAMAFWLWRTRAVREVFSVPMFVIVAVMVVTAVLCKTATALILFTGILAVMLTVRYLGTKFFMYALLAFIPLFLAARATQAFTGTDVAVWMEGNVPLMEDRAKSLRFRMDHENAIIGHTYERPIFGWGGWGRAFDVYLPEYNMRAVPDSLWIYAFGQNGIVGLAAIYGLFLIPPWVLLSKLKVREWAGARCAPLTGMAMICLIFAMDGLFNNMDNPVFIVAIGAVAGMAASVTREAAAGRVKAHDRPRPQPPVEDDAPRGPQPEPLILLDAPAIDPSGPGGAAR